MFNWDFTLATILLASLILAARIEEFEDDLLSIEKDNSIYSSLAAHSYLPPLQYGDIDDSPETLEDEALNGWLCREHYLNSDYSNYLESDEPQLDDNDLYSLVLRDAKGVKPAPAKPASTPAKPAKESKAEKNAAKAAKTTQDNTTKTNKKAKENTVKATKPTQAQEKKTKDNTAKAERKAKNDEVKAERQVKKDQKQVKDNLASEKKAQNKASIVAQKKIDGVQRKNQKENADEDRNFQKKQKKLTQDLSRAEGDYSKQKGKKGEAKAAQKLGKAKATVANLPDQHKAKINKLYQQAVGQMAKDRKNLDKDLTKAHTDQFDASGKAKEHKSFWSKLGTIMSYLGPAMLSFIPGVGPAMMGAMTAGRAASAAVQASVKEGVKTGVKQGTKQGTKQATKKGPPPIDWKKAQPDQIKASQLNRDSKVSVYDQKVAQAAQALKHQKRDLRESSTAGRLTPRRIYKSAKRTLIEDMIWDDLIYGDI